MTLTAPTSGQSFAAGSAVTLSATASDPGGAVIRVEFRVDGTLVSSDTTSPYSFNATGLAAGSHTATATAFDNGTPTLSTATAAVPFTIGASGAVFRVNPAGRITKNGTVFPVRCGSWFGLEGRRRRHPRRGVAGGRRVRAVRRADRADPALLAQGTRDLEVVSNNCGVDGRGLGVLLAAGRIARVTGSYVGENKEFARQYLGG